MKLLTKGGIKMALRGFAKMKKDNPKKFEQIQKKAAESRRKNRAM
jgi:hypothetical protein